MRERQPEDVILHFRRSGNSNRLVGDFLVGESGKFPSLESVVAKLKSECESCPLFTYGICNPESLVVESFLGREHLIVGKGVPLECKLKGADIHFLVTEQVEQKHSPKQ